MAYQTNNTAARALVAFYVIYIVAMVVAFAAVVFLVTRAEVATIQEAQQEDEIVLTK